MVTRAEGWASLPPAAPGTRKLLLLRRRCAAGRNCRSAAACVDVDAAASGVGLRAPERSAVAVLKSAAGASLVNALESRERCWCSLEAWGCGSGEDRQADKWLLCGWDWLSSSWRRHPAKRPLPKLVLLLLLRASGPVEGLWGWAQGEMRWVGGSWGVRDGGRAAGRVAAARGEGWAGVGRSAASPAIAGVAMGTRIIQEPDGCGVMCKRGAPANLFHT